MHCLHVDGRPWPAGLGYYRQHSAGVHSLHSLTALGRRCLPVGDLPHCSALRQLSGIYFISVWTLRHGSNAAQLAVGVVDLRTPAVEALMKGVPVV
jgi:hypothetical protein